jgi:glutamate-1-semialdehyde 2,1-aminomutase
MASSAAIPIINPTEEDIKIRVKTGRGTMNLTEALDAARKRFVERNPSSLKLYEEATKSLPGGNTRHVLFTAPFPVYLKRGEGYQVISEDNETYV